MLRSGWWGELRRLAEASSRECEFLEWERGIGGGSPITLRFGARTKEIVTGYRENLTLAIKA